MGGSETKIVFKQDARKTFLNQQGKVVWEKVQARFKQLAKVKVSLANKYFTQEVGKKARSLPDGDQQRLLDILMGGLCNDDSSVGAYATRPQDYDVFSFFLEPLIRQYHKIEGQTKQTHDWSIPVGEYVLTKIDPRLEKVSMRARVARNVKGWNLPPSMNKEQRLKFQNRMVEVFESFGLPGKYHSLTPGHKNFISNSDADKLRDQHFLFNDMTTDNHLTSSGVASDWPHGRGIWISEDQTKMIWVGQEDQLRIISIVQGNDLGKVDASLHELLTKIEKSGLEFAEHPTYGVITTCPTNMGTGKRQSILGKFPNITNNGQDQKKLKQLAKSFSLQARGMGGEHSAMDKEGTADISPTARFGVTEAIVTKKLYQGLKKLYAIQCKSGNHGNIVFKQSARRDYLNDDGKVVWQKVQARFKELSKIKVSLANKYFTEQVGKKARALPDSDQQRLLDIVLGGLCNDDSSVGAYATRPEDYDVFSFFLEPLIREYHKIEGQTKQTHDWSIPVGQYVLTKIDPKLEKVSMRARVARNVKGWNLPPSMNKEQRLKFQNRMVEVFESFGLPGKYHSLTPGHKNFISNSDADKLRNQHFLFNDMTTDNHLTSSGVASDWPHGRGIWISEDQTKMIWVGQEDQLRIISIVQGNDLGKVDASLHELLTKIQKSGLQFAEHPTYGVITTCPTNMGTGKRQSILGKFPNITGKGQNEKKLKDLAREFSLQARGMGGEHSAMDKEGTADISPTARFGVTQSIVTKKLYEGLKQLYAIESHSGEHGIIIFKQQARQKYLDGQGKIVWEKVEARFKQLSKIKVSLANKYFTQEVGKKARTLPDGDQQRLLDILLGGLCNDDSSVGAYATRPQDYDVFSFFLEPLIRQYHKIEGQTKQTHDWSIPVGQYVLTKIDPKLEKVSMRARVARNVKGWNLPPSMNKEQRLKFQNRMVEVFESFGLPGKYHSLTPGHKNFISNSDADKLRNQHFLFNDMTTDNHLTSSGVASDWPHGRGIWISEDQTKMIWVGQEDQLRIISIVQGNDLGKVDASLHELLTKIQKSGLQFAEHPTYGVITTCPTNMGTGKRQSILGKFPNITGKGQNEKKLKDLAREFSLQARGMGGEHSAMDKEGTADISPTARFGVTEAIVTKKLYEGLKQLYQIQRYSGQHGIIIFKKQAMKKYTDGQGKVVWDKVVARFKQLAKIKVSLANKYFNEEVQKKARTLPDSDQERLLEIIMGGLCNEDSSVGAYATRPEDYDVSSFFLEPLIREYHKIQGQTKQTHDWNIPVGQYVLTKIDPKLEKVSMRARVARNVKGWNLPPSMNKEQRIKFEQRMVKVFQSFGLPGKYHSLTPGHKNFISNSDADKLRHKHFLFNDMTTDNHLTSSGVASDWPHGRGIWISEDQTKMIWIGEEDQLRIISIVQGNDLGKVDASLHQLLTKIEKSGLQFAEHPTYGVITTCPTNMGTGKRQSILGKFPNITKNGTDQKKLKQIARTLGLQARGMGGEHSAMDKEGTADISPSARFGVTEAIVTKKLYQGLVKLYQIQKIAAPSHQIVFLKDARKQFLDSNGKVDFEKVQNKWKQLSLIKVSLANKYFTPQVMKKAESLPQADKLRLLDVMMGGLCNPDSSVGAYATRPEDYDNFGFYLEPLIREYHKIEGQTKQTHDWNIPVGEYVLTKIDPRLEKVSMRARVARNVKGWNLPPSMDKDQRIRFQNRMVQVFQSFGLPGKYHSLTPGHKNFISNSDADKLRNQHFLFNDMTTDNHLTSSGVASDWPHGRGIWISEDQTKMIWVGQEDQLRIISIVQGNDLGKVDASLHELLTKIEKSGLEFAEHPTYGVITTCPTNMGTGKRQSILGKFPNITLGGRDEARLKQLAKSFGLQARGMGGEHSAMDKEGTADISPSARFGVTEAIVTKKLYEGLVQLCDVQRKTPPPEQDSCKLI